MDDLTKAAEESDDKGYESKVIPTTNRSVPTRNCKKNVVYHMDGIESEDEYWEKYSQLIRSAICQKCLHNNLLTFKFVFLNVNTQSWN